jgi:hypothetical protein
VRVQFNLANAGLHPNQEMAVAEKRSVETCEFDISLKTTALCMHSTWVIQQPGQGFAGFEIVRD